MFNIFKKSKPENPKPKKLFLCNNEYIDMFICIIESTGLKNNDEESIAYIRTPYYHSFGIITQKQFDHFQKDFPFQNGEFTSEIPTIEQLSMHDYSIHHGYEDVKKDKIRLNLAIIYLFYCPIDKVANLKDHEKKKYLNVSLMENSEKYYEEKDLASPEELATFFPYESIKKQVYEQFYTIRDPLSIKNLLDAIKSRRILEVAYNDYDGVLFGYKSPIDYNSNGQYVYIDSTFNHFMSDCKNYNEIIDYILKDQKNRNKITKDFITRLKKHIIDNIYDIHKMKEDYSVFTLNQNLINQLVFLAKYIDYSLYTFDQILVLLDRIKEKRYFFNENMFFPVEQSIESSDDYYFAFIKNLNFLENQDFDIYKVLMHWNVYFSTMKKAASYLDNVKFKLDNSRFKDMNRTYNFLGKRLSENVENFELQTNNENFNEDMNIFQSLSIDGYQVSIIKDFEQLKEIGMKLDNCAGSLITLDYYKNKLCYTLSNDKELFLGCIHNGQFEQLKGYKNASPNKELFIKFYDNLVNLNFVASLDKQDIRKSNLKAHKNRIDALYTQECVQNN